MKIHFLFVSVGIILILFIGGFAQAKKCDNFDKKVNLKILTENITMKNAHTRIFLEIYIEPRKFTIDSMIQLIERIKNEYCNFDSIAVAIYDTKKLKSIPNPPQPLIDWTGTSTRGFYEFDRKENKGELSFREKRNDKEFDIEIIFNSDGYCVTEKTLI